MNTVKDHYDRQLAAVYSWMTGDPESVIQKNRALFRQLAIDSLPRGWAIDLGAGSGFQSIPLAELGFSVVAIDFCEILLTELRDRAAQHSAGHSLVIQAINDDILNFPNHLTEKAQVIVCMGDTLTHLESPTSIQLLLDEIAESLAVGGKLVLTFRDYITVELQGTQRFIPVHSDDSTILTCFLDYHQETVEVHDLLYQKQGDRWVFQASSYPKLRLDKDWVADRIELAGLRVIQNEILKGMVCLIAEKI